MTLRKKILLLITFLLGILIPFIPELVVIEAFFLLIPLALAFLITLILLILDLFDKDKNKFDALFSFSIIPIFIFAQFFSGLLVDKIQKIRCNKIISDIQTKKRETEIFPESYKNYLGIHYKKLQNERGFELSYERGFMVTEVYSSENGLWKSYGWND